MTSKARPSMNAGFACAVAAILAAGSSLALAEPFRLSSPAFADGGLMARTYAGRNPSNPNCMGENVSPPLQWTNAPAATRSYAIIMHDQEGRNGIGVDHWVAYGIPAATTSLPEGAGDGRMPALVGGKNLLGVGTYFGGCPPHDTGPHHYVLTLIATDLEPGALPPGLTIAELLQAIGAHALGAAGLVGRYGQ
jgi:Raf kinase inhibitor-like YbhB/YbcL family protein